MQQTISFADQCRSKLLQGAQTLAAAVRISLGPKGRNAIFSAKGQFARATKDGVSIAGEVELQDEELNAGCKLIRQAAQETADSAGDGTTTSVILAYEMMKEADKMLREGANPVDLKNGLDEAKDRAIAWIAENSIKIDGDVEKVKHIARISSNNDKEISSLIGDAFDKIGADGIITVEHSETGKSFVEIMGGYSFDRGYVHPYFITNPKTSSAELIAPYILFYDKRVSKMNDLKPVMEYCVSKKRPLLIVIPSCEGEALGFVITNKVQGIIQVCVVQAPDYGTRRGEQLEDMAIFTGAQVVSEEKGLGIDKDNFKPEYLGQAQKVIVTEKQTTIISGQGDPVAVKGRRDQILDMVKDSPSNEDKEYLRKRAGSISKGCAILRIGAATEMDQGAKKDLADDAVLAVRSALEEGYLPGGGTGLIRCATALFDDETKHGENILWGVMNEPLTQILANCGKNAEECEEIINKITVGKDNYGYNAYTGEFGDLVEMGVLDSAKVVRCAIENATSVTGIFMYSEVLIAGQEN